MHISTRVVTALLLSSTAVIFAATLKIDFSTDVVGQTPKGFEFGHTKKVGAPGKWVVQAEGTNKYLAQTAADSTGSRFPVAVLTDITTADADVSVRFKPVSGRVDQAAGSRFEVHFNGTKLYEVEDTTFAQAGKVGVWTKADSVTYFDDLTVGTK